MNIGFPGQPGEHTLENRNIAVAVGMSTLSGMTLLLSSGALWQGLLLHYGISSAGVGILISAASIVQALAMFCNIYFSDRFRQPIRAMTMCSLPSVAFFLVMAVLCFTGESAFSLPLLLFLVVTYNFFYGLRGIIEYKIPFLIYPMKHYGRVTAVTGISTNVLTTLVSMGIPALLQLSGYDRGMCILFIIGVCMAAGTTILNGILRPLPDAPATEQTQAPPLSQLLKEKSFRALALPDFLRGISMGIVSSIALIAAHSYNSDSTQLSLLVSVGTVASILGNVLFTLLGKQQRVKDLCLISSIGLFVLGAGMIFPKRWAVFLALYLLLQICRTIIDGTIPVMVAQFIRYQIIGGYTSLRLMITTTGSALSSAAVGFLIDRADPASPLPTIVLLLTAGVSQLYTGSVYYRYVKKEGSDRYGKS